MKRMIWCYIQKCVRSNDDNSKILISHNNFSTVNSSKTIALAELKFCVPKLSTQLEGTMSGILD